MSRGGAKQAGFTKTRSLFSKSCSKLVALIRPHQRDAFPLRLTFATAFALLATVAVAQIVPRAPKPYTPVSIARPAPSADPGLVAFRSAIVAATRSRLYADLEALVQSQGFFWDRDFDRAHDPRRPSADNLAAAISLERGNGAGWDTLAMLAAEGAVEPLESRPGVVCAPARPVFDSVELSSLLDKSYTGHADWAYPRADETALRAAPRPDAPAVGRLGLQFVRLLGFEGAGGERTPELLPGRSHWARVVLPDGRAGYAAPGSLMSLTGERLCYIKDLVLGWRIAGFIAARNQDGAFAAGTAGKYR
jgi:hypothetical protein